MQLNTHLEDLESVFSLILKAYILELSQDMTGATKH